MASFKDKGSLFSLELSLAEKLFGLTKLLLILINSCKALVADMLQLV